MVSELDKLIDGNLPAALAEMRGEFRTIAAEVKGGVDGLRMTIETQASANAAQSKLTSDAISRMETHQQRQGEQLRKLDHVPVDIGELVAQVHDIDTRVSALERDRARFFGFVLGAAAIGGGLGTIIGQVLGGG